MNIWNYKTYWALLIYGSFIDVTTNIGLTVHFRLAKFWLCCTHFSGFFKTVCPDAHGTLLRFWRYLRPVSPSGNYCQLGNLFAVCYKCSWQGNTCVCLKHIVFFSFPTFVWKYFYLTQNYFMMLLFVYVLLDVTHRVLDIDI